MFQNAPQQFSLSSSITGPRVQIHVPLHPSLSVSGHIGESLEIRARARDLRSRTDPTDTKLAEGALANQNGSTMKPARAAKRHVRAFAPSFKKRRDARCRACFKKRYGLTARAKRAAPNRQAVSLPEREG
jgi:hypothetical protein